MMRTVSLIFFLIEFRKYETLELLNHFTKINPPCQLKNFVFTTLSGCSRVHEKRRLFLEFNVPEYHTAEIFPDERVYIKVPF
jgi:hypothetical protein